MLTAAIGNGSWFYIPVAPTITSPAFLVTGTVGTLYPSTQFTASGTAPITWSVTAGTLPTGMTFSSAGVLSGTPTATASGSITFTATNAIGSDSKSLALTVNAVGAVSTIAPFDLSDFLPEAVEGSAYSFSLAALGSPDTSTSYTWTSIGTALPAGMVLYPSGNIGGTPTSAQKIDGLRFRCANAAGATDTITMSLIVRPKIVANRPDMVKLNLQPISDYTRGEWQVERSVNAGSTWTPIARRANVSPVIIDYAPPTGAVKYRAKHINDATWDVMDATVPASFSAPSAVANVAVSSITQTTAIVSWDNDFNSTEDYFVISVTTDGGSTWRELCRPRRKTKKVRVVGLVGGTANQQIRVVAVNPGGSSSAATSSTFATPAYSGSAPAAPDSLTAIAADSTNISIQFHISDLLCEGSIVEISTDGGSTYTQKTIYGKQVWDGWLVDLTASTSYRIRVRRFGNGGYSAYSNVVTVSTLASGVFYSPTGHTPKGLWTPHLQENWKVYQTAYNANPIGSLGARFYGYLLAAAGESYTPGANATTGTPGQAGYYSGPTKNVTSYEEYGFCNAVLYMLTGSTSQAVAAFEKAYNNLYYISFQNSAPPIIAINAAGANNPEVLNYGFTDDPRQYNIEAINTMSIVYNGLDSTRKASVLKTFERLKYLHMGMNFSQDTSISGVYSGINSGSTSSGDSDLYSTNFYGNAILSQSDLVVGNQFLASDDGSFLTDPIPYTDSSYYFGGFSPQNNTTTTSWSSTVFGNYAVLSSGGGWFESSNYDKNTPLLSAIGFQTLRLLLSGKGDNTDYFADIRTKSFHNTAQSINYEILPAYNGNVQYNDESTTWSTLSPYIFANYFAVFGGLAKGITNRHEILVAEANKFITSVNASQAAYAVKRNFYLPFNIDATTSVDRSALSRSYKTNTTGHLVHRDGWATTDSMFWFEGNSVRTVDHEGNYMADFQFNRKGIWACRSINSYGGTGMKPQGRNTVGIAGHGFFGGDQNSQPRTASQSAFTPYGACNIVKNESSDSYNYVNFEAYGMLAAFQHGGDNPPTYNLEYTRSAVYLPSSSKTSDCIVVVDRALAANPKLLPKFDRYAAGYIIDICANNINSAPALFEWHLRCETSSTPATPTASQTTWTLADGQLAKVDHLYPATSSFTRTIIDENNSGQFDSSSISNKSQLKYQVRLTPATAWPTNTTPVWYQYLNVFSVRDSGATVTNSLIQSSAGESAIGSLITRSSENDVAMLFCATPATFSGQFMQAGPYGDVANYYSTYKDVTRNRNFVSGFTASYTQTTASATVYAHDLLTTKSWTVSVNGGGATSLTVSSNGVASFAVSGVGSKSLVFVGT